MKIRKFNTQNQGVFFASDFHLSHLRDFVWKPRGYNSAEAHSKSIIDGINARVGENDVLFYLGDFSLNSNPEETRNYFRQIKCQNILYFWGNHESSPERIYKDQIAAAFGPLLGPVLPQEVYPLKWENVKFLGHYGVVSVNGQLIVLGHFAHFIWDKMQHEAWNVCGHSHGNCPELNPEFLTQGKVLDAGVDNALKITGTPCFSFEEVKIVMDSKPVKVWDHHNESTG